VDVCVPVAHKKVYESDELHKTTKQ